MKTIKIIYGSTTGNTERAAQRIASVLGGTAVAVSQAAPADFTADVLVLGTSTWGLGDLQDDWSSALAQLDAAPLQGRTVALFGLGDQLGFGATYIDGVGELYDRVSARGARVIGRWPTDGYRHDESKAVRDGAFVGLALDDDNEPGKTESRIAAWTDTLRDSLKD
ncbi:MAG: flavodoxin [Verrucomicrobiota bacterium]|jgi:flavodoxin I|nr:flavodoxin [Verrucomicrobiota bacterium]